MTEIGEFFYSNPWHNVYIPKSGHKVTYIKKKTPKDKLNDYLDSITVPVGRRRLPRRRHTPLLWEYYKFRIKNKLSWIHYYYDRIKYKLFKFKCKIITQWIRYRDRHLISEGLKVYYKISPIWR